MRRPTHPSTKYFWFWLIGCWVLVACGLAPSVTSTLPVATTTPLATATSPVSCQPPTSTTSMRFLALGDSYTIGESVSAAERWPVQLVKRLRDLGYVMDDPAIIARTGWTTRNLADGLASVRLAVPFDLVSLLIGVNNQYQGRSLEEYRREFAELLQQAIGYAGGSTQRVFVLSIPDWGVTPFAEGADRAAIGAAIDKFNAANRELTEAAGVAYVDITPISRQATTDPELIAYDGLHPSGRMYAAWVEAALATACRALQPTTSQP